MLEINQYTNLQSSYFQVIPHFSDFMVSDSLDRFRINNDLFKADQIRDVFPQLNGLVNDRELRLLQRRNVLYLNSTIKPFS